MSAYATLCPHFRKINLGDPEISGRRPEAPHYQCRSSVLPIAFSGTLRKLLKHHV